MTRSKTVVAAGQKVTRRNMRTDRLVGHGTVAVCEVSKRNGAGKANWGRPGDELLHDEIDEHDPAYDSADELFERAFGGRTRNTNYDWAAVADLSEEDDSAMDEIEEAMRSDWLAQVELERVEVEEEGEAFFGEGH